MYCVFSAVFKKRIILDKYIYQQKDYVFRRLNKKYAYWYNVFDIYYVRPFCLRY
jgi:hypothetical protein